MQRFKFLAFAVMVTFCQQIVLMQMLSNWNVTIINKKTNKSSTKSALETNRN